MPVLVISNFDVDSIKNESASIETPFCHYKPMGNFFRPQEGRPDLTTDYRVSLRSQWSNLAFPAPH